jgi:hypothetical protein
MTPATRHGATCTRVALLIVGCGPPLGAEIGQGPPAGEDEGDGRLVCADAWISHREAPFQLEVAFGGADWFVAVDPSHVVSFEHEEWSVHPVDFDGRVPAAIWAAAVDDVWIVTHPDPESGGQVVFRWRKGGLVPALSSESPTWLTSVGGRDPDDVWVVGGADCTSGDTTTCDGHVQAWQDGEWTVVPTPTLSQLTTVLATSDGARWVLDANGRVARWTAGAWQILNGSGGGWIEDIAHQGSTIYARSDTEVLRWNGSVFEPLMAGDVPGFIRDFAIVAGTPWALSDEALFRDEGLVWGPFELHGIDPVSIVGVGLEPWIVGRRPGASSSSVVAGLSGTAEVAPIRTFDSVGTIDRMRAHALDDLWGLPSAGGLASFDGATWSWRAVPDQAVEPWTLFLDDAGRPWVGGREWIDDLGPRGAVWSFGDAGLQKLANAPSAGGSVGGLWATSERNLWVVTHAAHRFDGSGWITPGGAVEGDPLGVLHAAGEFYLRSDTTLHRLESDIWVPIRTAPTLLVAADMAARDSMWTIETGPGGLGQIARWDGERWASWSPGADTLCTIVARSPEDVFVLSVPEPFPQEPGASAILRFDGDAWTSWPGPMLQGCAELSVTDDGLVIAQGETLHRLPCTPEVP